jgi:DNA modification methylase
MAKQKREGSVVPVIEQIATTDLIPYARNSRTHSDEQVAQIAASIREFGFNNPVLIDAENTIIAGHGRVLAAGRIKLETVPCLRLTHLTDTQRRAYVIADNRIALNAGWDEELLSVELADLNSDEFDMGLLGFDVDELSSAMGFDADKELIEDEVPEPPADPITKPGDLWILGEHRLLCGDSTKAEDVARLMAGAKADLCFTSPPYNLGKSVGLRNGARSGATSAYNDNEDCGDGWLEMMRAFIIAAIGVSRSCAVNVQMLSGNKISLLGLLGEFADHTTDIAVWVKSNPPPAMADGVMTSAFEFVWLLSCEKEPSRKITGFSFSRGSFSNVFEHATASGHDASVHGAVFPIGVAGHFIGGWSANGSLVYEPFCGSGTTLIAAEQLGRKCYGMEISPAYCDVIVKRWETLTQKTATLEAA